MTDALWYEDFEPGRSFISRAEVMTRERIVAFATEFDPQPQHMSEAAAKDSAFGELVASGWHTASLTMRLQYEAALVRIPGGGMGAQVDKLAWLRPVRPGDAVRAVMTVDDRRPSRSRPDRGIVTCTTATLNQHDEIVQTMTAAILVPRKPSAGD